MYKVIPLLLYIFLCDYYWRKVISFYRIVIYFNVVLSIILVAYFELIVITILYITY